MKNICRNAFTLAEVLIVLSIIGIVAETTIPTLKAKIDKQVYVTELKKFYSMQMDGWSRLLADEGVDQLEDTSVFQSMSADTCNVADANNDACKPFFDNLKKYFRFNITISPDYKINYLSGNLYANFENKIIFTLNDGSIWLEGPISKVPKRPSELIKNQIRLGGGHRYSLQGWIYFDINGFKKPNTFGRDVFAFDLSGDGKVFPWNGRDDSLYNYGNLIMTWQNISSICGKVGSS